MKATNDTKPKDDTEETNGYTTITENTEDKVDNAVSHYELES